MMTKWTLRNRWNRKDWQHEGDVWVGSQVARLNMSYTHCLPRLLHKLPIQLGR